MPEPVTIAAAANVNTAIGFSAATFVAGAVGSMISWKWVPQLGFMAKLTSTISAAAIAVFVTPILKETSGITDQSVLFGAAGLIGIFGLSITASAINAIRDTKWGQIIESRLSRKPEIGG